MARKVTVELVDDFDGTSPAEETVTFALDGTTYEIDLSALNAKQLRRTLEQWTVHARRIGRAPGAKRPAKQAADTGERQETQKIREWARENGIDVSSRGRISADVVSAYQKSR